MEPDASAKDILLAMYKEQMERCRSHEQKREIVSTVIFAVVGALLAYTAKESTHMFRVITYLFIIALGIFGMLITYKHYERYEMHNERGRAFRRKLCTISPYTEINEIVDTTKRKHKAEFKISSKIEAHYLWMSLHMLIVAAGIAFLLYQLIIHPTDNSTPYWGYWEYWVFWEY
jgi:hypothetical protein